MIYQSNLQLFTWGRDYVLNMALMGIPLHICDIPSSALRKKTRDAKRRFEIYDKQPSPTVTDERKLMKHGQNNIRSKNDVAWSWAYTHLVDGLKKCVETSQDMERTLPTASPTKSLTLISQLERKRLPSSGDSSRGAPLSAFFNCSGLASVSTFGLRALSIVPS